MERCEHNVPRGRGFRCISCEEARCKSCRELPGNCGCAIEHEPGCIMGYRHAGPCMRSARPGGSADGPCNVVVTSTSTAQPPPQDSEHPAVWPQVIADMEERHRFGMAKYGKPLRPFDGRKPLSDAYEEVLDMAVYLRKRMAEDDYRSAHCKMAIDKAIVMVRIGPAPKGWVEQLLELLQEARAAVGRT